MAPNKNSSNYFPFKEAAQKRVDPRSLLQNGALMPRFSSFLKKIIRKEAAIWAGLARMGHRFTCFSIMLSHSEEVNDGGKNQRLR